MTAMTPTTHITDVEPLFRPFTLGRVQLRNRLVMAPMQKHRPPECVPGDELVEYYRERVRGGIGLVVTQGTTMDHPTTTSPYARLYPPALDGWRRCAEAVRSEGGEIVMQLWHEGAYRKDGWGPSAVDASGREQGQALSRSQIGEIIEVYRQSAVTAEALGFAGVELHYGEAYLLGMFLNQQKNTRDDEYGGDLDGRMRLGLEIARAIRTSVGPAFLVGVRTTAAREGGLAGTFPTPADLGRFVTAFEQAGVTHFHGFSGQFWTPEYPDLDSDLSYSGWIKRLSSVPVITVGSVGLSEPLTTTIMRETVHHHDNIAELMRRFYRGDFDLVALGRTVLTDPQWPTKLREGRFLEMPAELSWTDVFGGALG